MQSTLAICSIMMMMFLLVEKSQATPVANAQSEYFVDPYYNEYYSNYYTTPGYGTQYKYTYNTIQEGAAVEFGYADIEEANFAFVNADVGYASYVSFGSSDDSYNNGYGYGYPNYYP